MYVPLWIVLIGAFVALNALTHSMQARDMPSANPTDRWDDKPPSRWRRAATRLEDGLIWIAAFALGGACIAAGWIIFR